MADVLPTRDALPRQRGFTMIELITVMILVGIMAVAVMPRMDTLRGFDEIGYRDKLKGTLEYARKSAVAQRRNVRVTIVDSAVTVEVQRQTPELDGVSAWAALNLPGTNSNSFNPPASNTLSPDDATITFTAQGAPVAGAAFTVAGGAGTITLEAVTGYVH